MSRPNIAQSGVIDQNRFAVADSSDSTKQFQVDVTALATGAQAVLVADALNNGRFALPPLTTGTLANQYKSIQFLSLATASFTSTILSTTDVYLMTASGTVTTFTNVLPVAPPNGSKISITSSVAVTNYALTAGAGDSVAGGPAALTANTPIAVIYYASGTTWYRCI